jgi:hypothetical protein
MKTTTERLSSHFTMISARTVQKRSWAVLLRSAKEFEMTMEMREKSHGDFMIGIVMDQTGQVLRARAATSADSSESSLMNRFRSTKPTDRDTWPRVSF